MSETRALGFQISGTLGELLTTGKGKEMLKIPLVSTPAFQVLEWRFCVLAENLVGYIQITYHKTVPPGLRINRALTYKVCSHAFNCILAEAHKGNNSLLGNKTSKEGTGNEDPYPNTLILCMFCSIQRMFTLRGHFLKKCWQTSRVSSFSQTHAPFHYVHLCMYPLNFW